MSASGPEGDVPFEIRVSDLKSWLDEDRELVLIDVREPHEYQICRIEGSRLIPLHELPRRLAEIDGGGPIVVYCHHGQRSAHAVGFLRQQGVSRATNLAGGIDAWSREIDRAIPRY